MNTTASYEANILERVIAPDEGAMPPDLARYGEVQRLEPPKARLRIERSRVASVLAAILAQHPLEAVSVEEVPLEEVIAQVFSRSESQALIEEAAST
jgi:ABC-2 type transport system ATP-binding protein